MPRYGPIGDLILASLREQDFTTNGYPDATVYAATLARWIREARDSYGWSDAQQYRRGQAEIELRNLGFTT